MLKKIKKAIKRRLFKGSADYWESRYAAGGNSGDGSYGPLAEFKARVLNKFVADHGVEDVIEFGSGDGAQLVLAEYPKYLGVDVSETVVKLCREKFKGDEGKSFLTTAEYDGEQADLAMSLDVIYHLVEEEIYLGYMRALFDAGKRYVIIFAFEEIPADMTLDAHVTCWKFSEWIAENAKDWKLVEKIKNEHPWTGDTATGSLADFYIYEKQS